MKTIEIIKYINRQLLIIDEIKSTRYNILTIAYLADKLHLGKYGRTISIDNTYLVTFDGIFSRQMLKEIESNEWQFSEVNMDELSISDLECINQIIDNNRKDPFYNSVDNIFPHKEVNIGDNLDIIDLAHSLPNSEEILEHLKS